MKRSLFILSIAIPLLVHGQEQGTVAKLMATSDARAASQAGSRLDELVRNLNSRRPTSDVSFLKKVFNKTHREFLREYVPYSDFSGIFESGRYDCLTATALYSTVLDQLGFNYSIIETNYHIFLLVKTSRGEVLLETTDRFNGLVTRADEIAQRIGTYRRPTSGVAEYRYQCDLYNEVSPGRLPGLLYFNQAVRAFNAGDLEKCGELLSKARSIYDTPRIAEFSVIFLKSVVDSRLEQAAKLRIIRQFKGISPAKPAVLAAR